MNIHQQRKLPPSFAHNQNNQNDQKCVCTSHRNSAHSAQMNFFDVTKTKPKENIFSNSRSIANYRPLHRYGATTHQSMLFYDQGFQTSNANNNFLFVVSQQSRVINHYATLQWANSYLQQSHQLFLHLKSNSTGHIPLQIQNSLVYELLITAELMSMLADQLQNSCLQIFLCNLDNIKIRSQLCSLSQNMATMLQELCTKLHEISCDLFNSMIMLMNEDSSDVHILKYLFLQLNETIKILHEKVSLYITQANNSKELFCLMVQNVNDVCLVELLNKHVLNYQQVVKIHLLNQCMHSTSLMLENKLSH